MLIFLKIPCTDENALNLGKGVGRLLKVVKTVVVVGVDMWLIIQLIE